MKLNELEKQESMPVVNSKAAGIDVGSKSHFVSIGQQAGDIREFGCYTHELHDLCRWLKEEGITTVALESTGSYWRSLFVMLQDYGLKPILVNGRFTKNVKGKKTDVLDCQWIQKLHMLGLLEGSFIPDLFTETLRQYCRHRQSLLEDAAGYIKKMQKALRLTNIRLDLALRDVTGRSGRTIIDAILSGERDPKVLSNLVNSKVKKSKEEIAAALTGDWRNEYLFELRQSYEIYQYFHLKIDDCDQEIEKLLNRKVEDNEKQDGEARPEYKGKKKRTSKNDGKLDMQKLSYQLTGGIDLSSIEGIGNGALITMLSEIGTDLSAFPSAKHFCSWLRLSPNNKVSGGKLISNRTMKGRNRLAIALRQAANTIGHIVKMGSLHQFFKRVAYKKGKLVAITATARKLAVIIYNMFTKREGYIPIDQTDYLNKVRMTQLKYMQKKIDQLKVSPEELTFNIV